MANQTEVKREAAPGSLVTGLVEEDAEEAQREILDFRMVSFTLQERDYGIDIMKVKSIARESTFTFVPNVAPYVRGAHNRRQIPATASLP